jgi:hypothetical protein
MKRLTGWAVTLVIASILAVVYADVTMWNVQVYDSATLTATGNSGVLAFDDQVSAVFSTRAHRAVAFRLVGTGIDDPDADPNTADETVDVTLDFYAESSGTLSLGTITFDQLDPNTGSDLEFFPGDITALDPEAVADPLVPPYFKLTWTLAAADPNTISLSLDLYGDLYREE